jgi:hypothetical protein
MPDRAGPFPGRCSLSLTIRGRVWAFFLLYRGSSFPHLFCTRTCKSRNEHRPGICLLERRLPMMRMPILKRSVVMDTDERP